MSCDNSIENYKAHLLGESYVNKTNQLKNASIAAIAIGILAVVALGGIGIASLVQAHGIHMPQCFEWITPISQTQNAWGAWTMAACGTVLGTLAIVVGSRKYHVLKNANLLDDAQWDELYELITAENFHYFYDDEVNKFSNEQFGNHIVYRIRYTGTLDGNAYDEYAYMIKTPDGEVIPTPVISVDETDKHDRLTTLLGRLGYTLNTDPANSQDPEDAGN